MNLKNKLPSTHHYVVAVERNIGLSRNHGSKSYSAELISSSGYGSDEHHAN